MALAKKLENYLRKYNIDYEVLAHRTVYTAYDLAKTTKKKLSHIAKTVALKADNTYILVVVPASHKLNLVKLKKTLKTKTLKIVKETSLSKVFKIKPGMIVPFGTFHNVPIYIDKTLLTSRVILISSGKFTESLQVKTKSLLDQGAEAIASFSNRYLSDKSVSVKRKITSRKKISSSKKKATTKKKRR